MAWGLLLAAVTLGSTSLGEAFAAVSVAASTAVPASAVSAPLLHDPQHQQRRLARTLASLQEQEKACRTALHRHRVALVECERQQKQLLLSNVRAGQLARHLGAAAVYDSCSTTSGDFANAPTCGSHARTAQAPGPPMDTAFRKKDELLQFVPADEMLQPKPEVALPDEGEAHAQLVRCKKEEQESLAMLQSRGCVGGQSLLPGSRAATAPLDFS
eukprot:CAMPEP_0115569048 /NCGR_PEP_ID=MMETSP0271-20121206/104993_1 /TAXON_ID=71861 /ORGANISM="Scrippsiella trochoidea, Strain CCMP3099" /LENGTH=214 /DNA_ID=CAMNT_0003003563 /DNA_START=119 /DNA_END=761 /DNA_ORIENTATION=+